MVISRKTRSTAAKTISKLFTTYSKTSTYRISHGYYDYAIIKLSKFPNKVREGYLHYDVDRKRYYSEFCSIEIQRNHLLQICQMRSCNHEVFVICPIDVTPSETIPMTAW